MENSITSENEQLLLGVSIEASLLFENNINSACRKASAKLNALIRIAGFMDVTKRRSHL